MDCRTLRRVRTGLKLNCVKRDSFCGEAEGCGEPMSTGGVPMRIGGVPVRDEVEPVWCVLMLKAFVGYDSISPASESAIAPFERTRRAVNLRDVSRKM